MKSGHRVQVGRGTRKSLWILRAVVAMLALLAAEGLAANSLAAGGLNMPLPPPSHVLDAGQVFVRHPEKLEEISKSLKALEKKHGVPVYLAVYSGLIRTSVARQSKDLFDLWVGDSQDGIVVVCDTDHSRIDLGLPKASYYPTGDERAKSTRLPESRVVPIVRELKRDVDGSADPVDYLSHAVEILTMRLDELLSVEPQSWRDGSAWKVGVVTVVSCILLAILGFWASRFLRKADEKARESFHFPEVLVRSRLGANFGGGKVAVVNFAGDLPPAGEPAGEPAEDPAGQAQTDAGLT